MLNFLSSSPSGGQQTEDNNNNNSSNRSSSSSRPPTTNHHHNVVLDPHTVDDGIIHQCLTNSDLQAISYEHRFLSVKEFCCLINRHILPISSPQVLGLMRELLTKQRVIISPTPSTPTMEHATTDHHHHDHQQQQQQQQQRPRHVYQVVRVLHRVLKAFGVESDSRDWNSLLFELEDAQSSSLSSHGSSSYDNSDDGSLSKQESDGNNEKKYSKKQNNQKRKNELFSEYGDFDAIESELPEEHGMVRLRPRNSTHVLNSSLSDSERWTLVWHLLLLSVSDGVYDARIRVVLYRMCQRLKVDVVRLRAAEEGIAIELHQALLNSMRDLAKRNDTSNKKKYWAIGLAGALGGGALLITGGLAAPLVIPAVGAVIAGVGGLSALVGLGAIGAAAATAATTILAVGGVPMVTTLFGVYGAGMAGSVMNKRMSGLHTFEFKSLSVFNQTNQVVQSSPAPRETSNTATTQQKGGMQVVITVSGLVDHKDSMGQEWRHLDKLMDGFGDLNTLVYDPEILDGLTHVVRNLIVSKIAGSLKKFWIGVISVTLSTALASITWPLSILGLTAMISNPYSLAVDRAEKCGRLLAKVLYEDHVQGHRPVTLVGSSLGARAIFYCCEELARHNQKGIVENVFLIGAPVSTDPSEEDRWLSVRSVVAGRLVNAYSKNDWVLATIYRVMNLSFNVAGLFPLEYSSLNSENGLIENVDLSGLVESHFDYTKADRMQHILAQLQIPRSVPVTTATTTVEELH